MSSSPTGGTNFLFRMTMWLAAFVMLSSLLISWATVRDSSKSATDSVLLESQLDEGTSLPPPSTTDTSGSNAAGTAPAESTENSADTQ